MFELEIEKIRNGNRKAKPNPTGPKLNPNPAQTTPALSPTSLARSSSPTRDLGPVSVHPSAPAQPRGPSSLLFPSARGPLRPRSALAQRARSARSQRRVSPFPLPARPHTPGPSPSSRTPARAQRKPPRSPPWPRQARIPEIPGLPFISPPTAAALHPIHSRAAPPTLAASPLAP